MAGADGQIRRLGGLTGLIRIDRDKGVQFFIRCGDPPQAAFNNIGGRQAAIRYCGG